MLANGLQLPASFVQLALAIGRGELPDNWYLEKARGDLWPSYLENEAH